MTPQKPVPFLTPPSWSSPSASWEQVRPVRLTLILGVLLMVATGPDAFAGTDQISGVSEERIFISLAVYISSLVTVAGAFYILGRWTKGREAAQEAMAHNFADLLAKVTDLEAQIQDPNHAKGPTPFSRT